MITLLRSAQSLGRRAAHLIPWPEVFAGLLLVAGWGSFTWGIALLLSVNVWPVSIGLFFLSLFGWKFLYIIARDGLYRLTREPGQRR